MAHVRAVGHVVRAVGAHEELVGERRLVGGASRRVEQRLVGAGEPVQVARDQPERVVPRDRLVVGGALTEHHRLGDPALLPEPVVGAVRELADRVLPEERRVDAALRGLLGDRLGAVLAELGGVPVRRVGVGPRAALAVEALGLVQPQQGPGGARNAHLADRPLHRDRDGGGAGCGTLRLLDLDVCLVDVFPGCVRGHRCLRAVPSSEYFLVPQPRRLKPRRAPCCTLCPMVSTNQTPHSPSPYAAFIAGLPKAELHVHHVGSASPEIVAEARRAPPRPGPQRPRRARGVLRLPRLRALRRGLPVGGRPDRGRARTYDGSPTRSRARWPARTSGTPS